MYTVT
ncbi:hypothetical protein D043_2452A, partial [Vibrio parahaemolyticus EKP-021]